jgi:hypothetical protein
MSAAEAIAQAEAACVRICLAGDFIRYQSHGPPPARVLAALRAAKSDLVALLARYALAESGALVGDDLLADLTKLDFRVRRYRVQAALDDDTGQGRVPPILLLHRFAERQIEYGLALRALGAPDALPGISPGEVAS